MTGRCSEAPCCATGRRLRRDCDGGSGISADERRGWQGWEGGLLNSSTATRETQETGQALRTRTFRGIALTEQTLLKTKPNCNCGKERPETSTTQARMCGLVLGCWPIVIVSQFFRGRRTCPIDSLVPRVQLFASSPPLMQQLDSGSFSGTCRGIGKRHWAPQRSH